MNWKRMITLVGLAGVAAAAMGCPGTDQKVRDYLGPVTLGPDGKPVKGHLKWYMDKEHTAICQLEDVVAAGGGALDTNKRLCEPGGPPTGVQPPTFPPPKP